MKFFLKVIFVVLLLANCGVFIVLYPQFSTASVPASFAVENSLLDSSPGGNAKIKLISEMVSPVSEIYVRPEIRQKDQTPTVSNDEEELFWVSPAKANSLEIDSSE